MKLINKSSRWILTLKNFAPLRLCAFALIFSCFANAQTLAPGTPGKDAQWATAGKQAVGTSAGLESKVWFTLAEGVMTEVYYPNVMTANVHLLQFVVVNAKTKKVETERDSQNKDLTVNGAFSGSQIPSFFIRLMQERWTEFSFSKSTQEVNSLYFNQVTFGENRKWMLVKSYIADPENNSVMMRVRFMAFDKNLQLYIYYDPSLANSGMHDTAWNEGQKLLAKDGEISSALISSRNLTEISNGFYQISDGLEQLKQNGKIISPYSRAENGNVVQIAKVDFENWKEIDFTLGFGKSSDEALQSAKNTMAKGFDKTFSQYNKGWSDYVKTLPKVEAKYQAQFYMAAMILKAHEDKTKRGANIASLTVPWGGGANANEDNVGGYHLVWSRDLYQVATAFMALGDLAAANRALDFVFDVQQKPDGSVPQNSKLDGTPFWGSLQLDEVAFPLILAYQLKRFDKPTWENHVKRAADFIVKNGPKTPQERWEEEGGYSPSTIAAEIAGLVCAAEIAKKNGDKTSATLYLKTADEWQANIEKWTATTNGKYGDGNYYLRITQNGKPDAGDKIELNNGAGVFDEREIVDAGFLELVRLGIKSPDDPLILKSLKVIDEVIRVQTPNGDAFYRYNHDGYGEIDDGRRWNFDGKYTGKGRLWALLSGERGQYELALAKKTEELIDGIDVINRNLAQSRLEAMAKFANEGLMIPEQIWDSPDVPKNADKQFVPELKFGEGTGSATPLAWSMAQFIRLAVNLQAGKNLDTPDVVYNRYVLGKKESNLIIDSIKPSIVKQEKADEKGFIKEESKTNVTTGAPQPLPENPNLQNLLNLKVEETCFSEWGRFQLTAKQSELAKNFNRNPVFWKCKNGNILTILTFREEAKKVSIAGDFNDWKPTEDDEFTDVSDDPKLLKIYGTNKLTAMEFAPTARVEYKLIVGDKWITDPLNPNKVDNGVGGENSFFTMPDYQPTIWDKENNTSISGIYYGEITVDSKIYGKRTIKVYNPITNSNENFPLPTLYLQDGTDYISRAKAIQIQQNLVKVGKVKPFIMVFVDYKDRMKEYWANDDYAKFLATEVVPAIDKQYNTIKNRDGRAILGASLGGITSVHTALKYPEIFSRVGGQSSSFWVDDKRVVKELETLDPKSNQFRFYFDTGTLEGVENSRRVNDLLRGKGFSVVYEEGQAGHNWTAWRDRLADAFVALWK